MFVCSFPVMSYAANMATVKNGDNDGVGSFRAALKSGASTVKISSKVSSISITETLTYTGDKKLKIQGAGQTIDASALTGQSDILAIVNGADVSISNLQFVGNYSAVNADLNNHRGGKGIVVNVPSVRQGTVKVQLSGVTVTAVGNHGVHVSDCALRDQCGGGSGGIGQGSPASVSVQLDDVKINRVGYGKQDADGVRVDERGQGDIYFSAQNSSFIKVGADGIELDEGNEGDVIADVRNSVFDSNGEYCNLIPFDAKGPCDDDGERDVDDGFDIDEAGEGSIHVGVYHSMVSNNFDEGLDFDEQGKGDISLRVDGLLAMGNKGEGIKASEEDGGSLSAVVKDSVSVDNNGRKEGAELEESGAGNVTVRVVASTFVGGGDEKLKVEQEDSGRGNVMVQRSENLELDLEGVGVK